MIKRHYILLTFIVLTMFSSCKLDYIKYIKHQKDIHTDNDGFSCDANKPDTVPFVLSGGKILFEAEIDGKKDTVQFDTGCTIAMVETVSESQRPDVEFFQVPVNTVNRSKLEMATVPVKYSFANCEIQYTRSIVLMNDVPYCDKELSFKDMYPIVGTYGLFWRRLKLDFTNSCLRIICHHQDSIDLTGYQEVKCKYMLFSNALKIYLTIDGEEHECLFDTGNESGFIILKDKKRIKGNRQDDLHYEGSFAKSLSGASDSQRFCTKLGEEVIMGDYQCKDNVMYVPDMSFDNVGIGFISRFDWVLDPYHDKAYFKPRNIDLEQLNIYPYKLTTVGGEIKIANRCLSMNPRFEVGDVIKSVDGEEITEENICHYYELLRETKDWSAFDIQVKK